MGMSIDLHIYDYFDLVDSIRKEVAEKTDELPEGRTLVDFVERVLPKFGHRAGDKYITLWNEYYSDSGYNAGSELFRAVEMYFGIEDVFLGGYGYFGGVNAEEVFDDLEIESLQEEGYDEY